MEFPWPIKDGESPSDRRNCLGPDSNLFLHFDGLWFLPENDDFEDESDAITLPRDFINQLRMVQVVNRYKQDGAWDGVSHVPYVFDYLGDCAKDSYKYKRVVEKLETLRGMYGFFMCGQECIGVYNAVISAWVGPPMDRRIAEFCGVKFPAGVSIEDALGYDVPKRTITMIRHTGDIGRIKY